jgi:hypothetical protein
MYRAHVATEEGPAGRESPFPVTAEDFLVEPKYDTKACR